MRECLFISPPSLLALIVSWNGASGLGVPNDRGARPIAPVVR
jgi:hypothetical protein